jgi:hypothetical protein
VNAIPADRAGAWIKHSKLGPAIAADGSDAGVAFHDLQQCGGSGFNQEEQPHGLMNIDSLPWQPGPEVTGGTIHHAEE